MYGNKVFPINKLCVLSFPNVRSLHPDSSELLPGFQALSFEKTTKYG